MEIFGKTILTIWILWTSIFIGEYSATARWQSDLINRGMAQYCPDTGEWAFKGECEG